MSTDVPKLDYYAYLTVLEEESDAMKSKLKEKHAPYKIKWTLALSSDIQTKIVTNRCIEIPGHTNFLLECDVKQYNKDLLNDACEPAKDYFAKIYGKPMMKCEYVKDGLISIDVAP